MSYAAAPDQGTPVKPLPASTLDLMRNMAHELRQPLSSIESIAYYLTLVLPEADSKVHEQLFRIQELIEQSHWILSNGLRLAIPMDNGAVASEPQADLEEAITEALSARMTGQRWHFQLELAEDVLPVHLNPRQIKDLIEALIMVFRQISTPAHPVMVRTRVSADGRALLEFESRAPGYRSESALGPGSALGLESARRIASLQGGTLEAHIDPESVSVRVELR